MKTKSNNNPSKLQSEAVKEFNLTLSSLIKNISVGQYNDKGVNIGFKSGKEVIEQFLSDQIQKAYSNGREEAVEVIKKHRPVFFKGDLKSLLSQDEVMTVREVLRIEILEELGIDCSKMRLSIQSKGKMK